MVLKTHNEPVIRAAIDIGSGGPKLRVAEVDVIANKVTKILHIEQYPVVFQESLSRNEMTLHSEVMNNGLAAMRQAINSAQTFGVKGIVLIGASIFRNAVNGDEFAGMIQRETGLELHVLNQELEGRLAFQAAAAKVENKIQDLIVWDIGGGSTQWIGMREDMTYHTHGSTDGSGAFRDFIIASIQQRDLKEHTSPNPLTADHAVMAETHARGLSEKVDGVFKEKIRHPRTKIIGVGSAFGRGIASLMRGKTPFTVEDLDQVTNDLIGKTDNELGGGDFSSVEVSNALLVLGFMKGLNIAQMNTVDVNNADGALVYKPFWKAF